MAPYDGCLVLWDEATGQYTRYNAARCAERFSPCSTFKIPNSLIALDAGVLADENEVIRWDGVERSRAALNRDHDLRSAIRDSVVWYYQELARRVGAPRMQAALDRLNYGNRDISAGLTRFWLGSSLKISADEQVAFLRQLQRGELPISARSQEIVRRILILREADGAVLRGKTGTHGDERGTTLGWFVGTVSAGQRTWTFALNTSGPGASGIRTREIALRALPRLIAECPAAVFQE
jgi:beta-lactamase class D